MATVERLELEKRPPLTVDEFYVLAEQQGWCEDDRIELLDGELVWMNPIGNPHAACVSRLNHVFSRRYADGALLWVQNPVQPSECDLPQPDVALLRPREDFYASRRAIPDEILLVVEVADSTLRTDLGRKARIYAAAGIPEYWVADVTNRVIYVDRDPERAGYATRLVLSPAEQVHAAFAPDVVFTVSELIG